MIENKTCVQAQRRTRGMFIGRNIYTLCTSPQRFTFRTL
jgi:hypothetical protein